MAYTSALDQPSFRPNFRNLTLREFPGAGIINTAGRTAKKFGGFLSRIFSRAATTARHPGFLKDAFWGAGLGAVLSGGAKYAAIASGPLGVAFAPAATGLALTTRDMIKDLKALREEKGGWKAALNTNVTWAGAKHYSKIFAKHTATGAIGSGLFHGADWLLEHTEAGNRVADAAKNFFAPADKPSLLARIGNFFLSNVEAADDVSPEANLPPADDMNMEKPESVPAAPEEAPRKPEKIEVEGPIAIADAVDVPVPSALDRLTEELAARGGLGEKAKSTLALAQNGNAQAIKDLAMMTWNGADNAGVYGNGFEGLAQDRSLAIELYQQAAALGNRQAIRDIADITKMGLMPQDVSAPEINIASANEAPVPAPETVVHTEAAPILSVEEPPLETLAGVENTPVVGYSHVVGFAAPESSVAGYSTPVAGTEEIRVIVGGSVGEVLVRIPADDSPEIRENRLTSIVTALKRAAASAFSTEGLSAKPSSAEIPGLALR